MNEDREYLKELVKPVLPVILSSDIFMASYYYKQELKKLKYLRRKDAQKLRKKRKKRKMKERKR